MPLFTVRFQGRYLGQLPLFTVRYQERYLGQLPLFTVRYCRFPVYGIHEKGLKSRLDFLNRGVLEVRRAGAPAAAGERLARAVKGTFPSAPTPSAKLCGRTGPGVAHTACCVQGVSADSSQLVFSRLAARGIRRGGERCAREGVKLFGRRKRGRRC